MQTSSRFIMAALALSCAASLFAGSARAQDSKGSQAVTAPKEAAPSPGRVDKSDPQAASSRWSSEESRSRIPADVPKAERVAPGK